MANLKFLISLDKTSKERLTCTFYVYYPGSSILCDLLQTVQSNDHKWIGHCENHPDINHLYIASHWQRLRNSHEAANKQIKNQYLRNTF